MASESSGSVQYKVEGDSETSSEKTARKVRRYAEIIAILLLLCFGVALMSVPRLYGVTGWLRELLDSIGATVFGTAVVAVAYEVVVRSDQQALAEKCTKRWLHTELDRLRNDMDSQRNFNRFGLARIHASFSLPSVLTSLMPPDRLWILDTYDRQYKGWLKDMEGALLRGVEIHILVVDPGSAVAEMRATEITDSAAFTGDVQAFAAALKKLQARHKKNLKIRYYADLPCAPIYAVEQGGQFMRGYSSYFLDAPTNGDFPHLQWLASASFGASFMNYLKSKWDRAERPLSSMTTPVGQWIYAFVVDGDSGDRDLHVYGVFSVYRQRFCRAADGEPYKSEDTDWEDCAEGEAFYVGVAPDKSSERRGLWRSTQVTYDKKSLTVHYDMVIQNGLDRYASREASTMQHARAPSNCYMGFMRVSAIEDSESESLFDAELRGEIHAIQFLHKPPKIIGHVRAKRLTHAIPRGRRFAPVLREAFQTYFQIQIFSDDALARPARTLATEPDGRHT